VEDRLFGDVGGELPWLDSLAYSARKMFDRKMSVPPRCGVLVSTCHAKPEDVR
jgi:hypothetical protein